MKTFPTPKITAGTFAILVDPTVTFFADVVGYFASQTVNLTDAGLSGYQLISQNMSNPAPAPGEDDHTAGIVGQLILQDNEDFEAHTKIFKHINDTIQRTWKGSVRFNIALKHFDSFLAWYGENYDMGAAGGNLYLISRLLPAEAFQDPKLLGQALVSAAGSSSGTAISFFVGKGVQEAKPAGGSNSINPAWRTAYLHSGELIFFLKALDMFFSLLD